MIMDLTDAYEALGEISGETLEEDIIDRIFSEFCQVNKIFKII